MLAIFAACVLAGLLVYSGSRIATHNEGVVLPGELYRSGQLDDPALAKFIEAEHIRTVINLRGENGQAPWYRRETELCQRIGVQHVDVRWSAKQLPPPAEVDRLLAAYRDAPRPILLHCRSGSDRTGLASAIFLIDQAHLDWQSARQALSWQYGHFAIYPYFEMDEFIQLYGQSHGKSLATWAAQDYPAIYADEMKETTWDEVMEPFELMVRGSL